MCRPGQPPASPATAGEALWVISAGRRYLATADPASWTTAEQAGCLRALEQAASMHTAARSRVLAAFAARGGYEDDGHGSARTWLRWQTRVTTGAAYQAIGWMRRLAPPPPVARAPGAGGISAAWGRQICEGAGLLPPDPPGEPSASLLGGGAGAG